MINCCQIIELRYSQGTVGVPKWPGYEVKGQLVFTSALGMSSWCPWSCCHHTIPSCCSSSLQERFMSLEKELFPFMAQDGELLPLTLKVSLQFLQNLVLFV